MEDLFSINTNKKADNLGKRVWHDSGVDNLEIQINNESKLRKLMKTED